MAITTAQLHSTKPEHRFCTGSNPACGVLEIHDSQDLWQWSWLEIRPNAFCRSTIPQKKFIIIIILIFWIFFIKVKFFLILIILSKRFAHLKLSLSLALSDYFLKWSSWSRVAPRLHDFPATIPRCDKGVYAKFLSSHS